MANSEVSENPSGETQANGTDKKKKYDPNAQLSSSEKVWAGILLVFFTCLSLLIIIAYWPDRIEPAKGTSYTTRLFHISLIEKDAAKTGTINKPTTDTPNLTLPGALIAATDSTTEQKAAVKKIIEEWKTKKELAGKLSAEALKKRMQDTIDKKLNLKTDKKAECKPWTIQLNSLLLILVAAAGFLGNMVHIASSLTAFVGSEQFKRTWILWYFTKPFTAMGLAVFLFFALNGSNIGTLTMANLYTIMTTAALAGLFTDIATQKLKEIFEVIFKPKDTRPDKLDPEKTMAIDIKAIQPGKINPNITNDVTIPGTNLDAKNLIIMINGVAITNAVVTPALIKFGYQVLPADAAKTEFKLEVTDKAGKLLGTKDWGV